MATYLHLRLRVLARSRAHARQPLTLDLDFAPQLRLPLQCLLAHVALLTCLMLCDSQCLAHLCGKQSACGCRAWVEPESGGCQLQGLDIR